MIIIDWQVIAPQAKRCQFSGPFRAFISPIFVVFVFYLRRNYKSHKKSGKQMRRRRFLLVFKVIEGISMEMLFIFPRNLFNL